MSQYLSFTFRNKDGVEFSETCYTTTPARELSAQGVFPYTETETQVTRDLLREYIQTASDIIFEAFDVMEKHKGKVTELSELMRNCSSKEVYTEAKKDMEEAYEIACYNESERKKWEDYRQHFYHLADLLEENKPDWKLYYTNC